MKRHPVEALEPNQLSELRNHTVLSYLLIPFFRLSEDFNVYRVLETRLKFTVDPSKHNGVYTCEASNSAGIAESGGSYLLNIPYAG